MARKGALARRAARAGADLARRRVGWSGREAARTTATRSAAEPRSSNSPLSSGRGGRHGARGRRQPPQERIAGARSAGSGVRRKPTPSSRLASGSAQARGRAHDGDEVGGGDATRRLALGLGTRRRRGARVRGQPARRRMAGARGARSDVRRKADAELADAEWSAWTRGRTPDSDKVSGGAEISSTRM